MKQNPATYFILQGISAFCLHTPLSGKTKLPYRFNLFNEPNHVIFNFCRRPICTRFLPASPSSSFVDLLKCNKPKQSCYKKGIWSYDKCNSDFRQQLVHSLSRIEDVDTSAYFFLTQLSQHVQFPIKLENLDRTTF